MTEENPKPLGNTLWSIADQMRGAMEADGLRAYPRTTLFLLFLLNDYGRARSP